MHFQPNGIFSPLLTRTVYGYSKLCTERFDFCLAAHSSSHRIHAAMLRPLSSPRTARTQIQILITQWVILSFYCQFHFPKKQQHQQHTNKYTAREKERKSEIAKIIYTTSSLDFSFIHLFRECFPFSPIATEIKIETYRHRGMDHLSSVVPHCNRWS